MKVGDLVKFESNSWVFQREDYVNPGVIVATTQGTDRYRVIWADQRITIEHKSYLKPLTPS